MEPAIELLRDLEPSGIELVEQPVAPDDLAGLRRVRDGSSIRVVADESASTVAGARRVIAERAADAIAIKPSILGAPRVILDLVASARDAGLGVVVTSALDGALGLAGALHLAAAIPGTCPPVASRRPSSWPTTSRRRRSPTAVRWPCPPVPASASGPIPPPSTVSGTGPSTTVISG